MASLNNANLNSRKILVLLITGELMKTTPQNRHTAPKVPIQGTYRALFLGAASALYNPAGLAPVLRSLSSLSSHIFLTPLPEVKVRQVNRLMIPFRSSIGLAPRTSQVRRLPA
jgi:hypothetical protein